ESRGAGSEGGSRSKQAEAFGQSHGISPFIVIGSASDDRRSPVGTGGRAGRQGYLEEERRTAFFLSLSRYRAEGTEHLLCQGRARLWPGGFAPRGVASSARFRLWWRALGQFVADGLAKGREGLRNATRWL